MTETEVPCPVNTTISFISPVRCRGGILTGYEAVIEEAAWLTARQIELSEDAKAELNRCLLELAARIEAPGEPIPVKLTWFEPDGLKLGGAYRTETVRLRRVDRSYRLLELADRSLIEIDRVLHIQPITE